MLEFELLLQSHIRLFCQATIVAWEGDADDHSAHLVELLNHTIISLNVPNTVVAVTHI